jgi:hypothetical protein
MDLIALRAAVENEIDNYVYEIHPEAIGQPWPQERVVDQLVEMRAALVQPTWRDVKIQDSMDEAECEIRPCVLVAVDREGYELYFDPARGDFVLAYSGNPPVTFNVRGDAVGCFMAR